LEGKEEMAIFLDVRKLKSVEAHWIGKYSVLSKFVIRSLASPKIHRMWLVMRRSCSVGLIKMAAASTYSDSLNASQLLAILPRIPRS
jgi:hypothetical protein